MSGKLDCARYQSATQKQAAPALPKQTPMHMHADCEACTLILRIRAAEGVQVSRTVHPSYRLPPSYVTFVAQSKFALYVLNIRS